MLEDISSWIEQNFHIGLDTQEKILYSLIAVLILLILRQLAIASVNRRSEDGATLYRRRKSIGYASLGLGILVIGAIWVREAGSLATYLGLLSAALVIALQDPITNFVGWAFIIWRRPFEVGDRIEIGEAAGDVIDVRFFQFTLMEIGNWVHADQSTGRVLHLPNRQVFNHSVANYSKGFSYIWNEVPVMITFESDWLKAKSMLHKIAEQHAAHLSDSARARVRQAAQRYMIQYEKLTPIVYTKVVDNGVRLTVRYLCDPRQRRNTEQAIWEDILRAFAEEPQIEFAYPTQRIYYYPAERSQGAKGGGPAPL